MLKTAGQVTSLLTREGVSAADDAPGLEDALLSLLPQLALVPPLLLQLHLDDGLLVTPGSAGLVISSLHCDEDLLKFATMMGMGSVMLRVPQMQQMLATSLPGAVVGAMSP